MLGLSVQLTDAGPVAPSYTEIFAGLQTLARGIYGSDIYIEADSKDGQFLALFAQALADCNDVALAIHAAFSPSTATGASLSSIVKTNGIKRLVSSYSTAPGLVVGQVGTVITNGVVKDANGNLWSLPASVTVPPAGQILVTVTAQQMGALAAPSGTINKITTPAQGWQSFASTADATPGAPVEVDPTLRKRQTVSTSLPALTPLGALQGALSNLAGVQRVKLYENVTSAVDANGIPAKSVCVVIQGGDLVAIARIIGQKKTPGADTYGTTAQPYSDPVTGIPYSIKFFILATSTVKVTVTGTAFVGYTTATAAAIKQAIVDYIATHNTGETVEYSGLWAPAYLNAPARLQPYKITNLQIALDAGALGVIDLPIAFNKIAANSLTDITVNIA